ncbi:hypothetical protein Clacol_004046 [Clathrus columnatus]|uniref:Sulfite efflux pump SSU1 n=1 Tax=Clathrus columnatus TaxID=1419009 RepID=A0AAV5A8H8_9AGAM|nr:hypothetical protein Clacol_004046 [Clathrus columnatus]
MDEATLLESGLLHLEPNSGTNNNSPQQQTGQQVFSASKTMQDVINIARYTLFSGSWSDMLRHPVQSLYLGCFPMAGSTLINTALTTVNQYFGVGGYKFLYTLWAFWWLDCLISFLCCFGVVYVMTVHHRHSMSTLTAIWLLPVVTVIVSSTTGQLLTPALAVYSIPHAHLTMGVALLMVIIGLSLSLMILTLYLRRLIIEGLPDVGAIISCFIPIGPCGQGGYSLLLAGQNFSTLLPNGHGYVLGDPLAGRAINFICFVGAWILWCMAVWWLGCAICAIFHNLMKGERMPFTLAFWGLVFPNGVNALLTIQLGNAMDSTLFHVLGSIHGAAVVLMWLLLVLPTVIHVWDRRIFVTPLATSPSLPLKA